MTKTFLLRVEIDLIEDEEGGKEVTMPTAEEVAAVLHQQVAAEGLNDLSIDWVVTSVDAHRDQVDPPWYS